MGKFLFKVNYEDTETMSNVAGYFISVILLHFILSIAGFQQVWAFSVSFCCTRRTQICLQLSVHNIFLFLVPTFSSTPALRIWHEKNHKLLELSDVHRETTEDIRVTVIPFYMGSRVTPKLY